MKRSRAFADALVRARRGQGFANGHAFYKARDGRRAFRMLYANYMALERGTSLPKPWRLEAILNALGLAAGSPQRRELVRAYLISVLGSDALLDGLEAAPSRVDLTSEEVAREVLRGRSAQIGLDQWRALAADPAAYYCHVYLINTPGWSTTAELSAAVRFPAARTKAAVAALAKARIVERRGDKARSLFAYKFLHTLPALPATINLRSAVLRSREAFAGERGTLAHRSNVTTRLTKANMERYFTRLAETVKLSGVYGDAEKAADTDVYFVDARIFKIFD